MSDHQHGTPLEQRAMMRECEASADRLHGATHVQLVFLLDRIAALQEELTDIRGSEEWTLALIERRPHRVRGHRSC